MTQNEGAFGLRIRQNWHFAAALNGLPLHYYHIPGDKIQNLSSRERGMTVENDCSIVADTAVELVDN